MLKSMTGYGRATVSTNIGRFVVEISSLNRKFFDLTLALPKELSRFENEVRKWIGEQVSRGQLTVKIAAYFNKETPLTVTPNLPLAKQLKSAWNALSQELNVEREFPLEAVINLPGMLIYGEEFKNVEEYQTPLHDAVRKALEDFIQMREVEGEYLQKDILSRLKAIREKVLLIASKADMATSKYRKKLIERIEEVLPGVVENEERILREIALYAEKIDIAEEITRFDSHTIQMEKLLQSTQQEVGKTLEFLVQELNREVNTIGSKSADVEISGLVIEIKGELKKIHEQIQNIE